MDKWSEAGGANVSDLTHRSEEEGAPPVQLRFSSISTYVKLS